MKRRHWGAHRKETTKINVKVESQQHSQVFAVQKIERMTLLNPHCVSFMSIGTKGRNGGKISVYHFIKK